jgi:hypothetical protein
VKNIRYLVFLAKGNNVKDRETIRRKPKQMEVNLPSQLCW